MLYTFECDGVLMIDRCAFIYYMGLGNLFVMMVKNVGAGSQYVWVYKDVDGDFFDGARSYCLCILLVFLSTISGWLLFMMCSVVLSCVMVGCCCL